MAKKSTKGSSHPNFKPLGDRVFVKPVEKGEETSAAGIIVPGSSEEEKTLRGEVVAVGPGRRDENGEHIPVSVSVGDVILFSRYGYDEVEVAGQEYYFVSEPNILAVIN